MSTPPILLESQCLTPNEGQAWAVNFLKILVSKFIETCVYIHSITSYCFRAHSGRLIKAHSDLEGAVGRLKSHSGALLGDSNRIHEYQLRQRIRLTRPGRALKQRCYFYGRNLVTSLKKFSCQKLKVFDSPGLTQWCQLKGFSYSWSYSYHFLEVKHVKRKTRIGPRSRIRIRTFLS